MAEPKTLRRCRWCSLILDDHAPMGAEMIAQPKGERKTHAHCTSPTCDWCSPCLSKRHADIKARETEQQ